MPGVNPGGCSKSRRKRKQKGFFPGDYIYKTTVPSLALENEREKKKWGFPRNHVTLELGFEVRRTKICKVW